MEKRRKMKQEGSLNQIEYREVCKTVRKRIREDCRQFEIQEIVERIKNNTSLQKARRQLAIGEKRISCILSKSGEQITNQDQILQRIEEFYTELYYDETQIENHKITPHPEILSVTPSEVRNALSRMPNGKAAGSDDISIEALKAGGAVIHKQLATLYTRCLQEGRIPRSWKSSKMILIHKKADNRDLKNYRPISLLSNIYKVFTKILTVRLTKILDENQPIEQAGFRSGYSTIDHIHTLNQLKEKCCEYQKPLCLAFVDYEKAFDSVKTRAILTSLERQGVEKGYIDCIAEIYNGGSTITTLHKESSEIPIRKGVRQGDTISPKLFTTTLEDVFRSLNWNDRGISINGSKLSNLRFADDVTLIGEDLQELELSLNELSIESKQRGLKINMSKTKILRNKHVDQRQVLIQGNKIEEAHSYIYLGQRISLMETDIESEVNRRIQAGWKSFHDHKTVLKANIPLSLKRKLYNQCILPTMTYGSETWSMTKAIQRRLASAQRSIERSMIGVSWRDHKTNEWVRNKSKVRDIIDVIKITKWTWAGHVARMQDSRWTCQVTDWRPMDGRRPRGRPSKRWRDEIDAYWKSVAWRASAQDRLSWRSNAEAFIQQVDR